MSRQSPDDGLRALLRKYMPQFHWNTIETGLTQKGVPDSEFCYQGAQAWIECKATAGWALKFDPFQVGWHLTRARQGGRSFIAVRRRADAGPRRGGAVDELWLFQGRDAAALADRGLIKGGAAPLGLWVGGPSAWLWARVLEVLVAP